MVGWYQVPKGARRSTAKRKPKPKLIATLTTTIRRVAQVRITIKLTAVGKRLVGHSRAVKLTGKGTFTPSGGRATSVRASFRLRR